MPSDAAFPISAKKSKTPPNNRFAMPSETVSDGIVSTRRKPMKAFTKITAIVAPLDRSNVDTDAIIPKQFLKSIKRSGFGPTPLTNGVTSTTANRAWTTANAR